MMVELPLFNRSTLGSRIGFPPFTDGAWEPTDSNVAGFEPSSPLCTSALLLASWVVVAHAGGSRSTRTSCSRHTCLGLCCAVKQRWTVAKSWAPWSGLQARSQCGATAGVGEKLNPFGSSRRPHKFQGGGKSAKGRREHHPQGGLSPRAPVGTFVLVTGVNPRLQTDTVKSVAKAWVNSFMRSAGVAMWVLSGARVSPDFVLVGAAEQNAARVWDWLDFANLCLLGPDLE